MQLRVIDHKTLLALNESSIQSGRRQNLKEHHLSGNRERRYWITAHHVHQVDRGQEVRMCVVLDIGTGKTAWLDLSLEEFNSIPAVEVADVEWEAAMCGGSPPLPPW